MTLQVYDALFLINGKTFKMTVMDSIA